MKIENASIEIEDGHCTIKSKSELAEYRDVKVNVLGNNTLHVTATVHECHFLWLPSHRYANEDEHIKNPEIYDNLKTKEVTKGVLWWKKTYTLPSKSGDYFLKECKPVSMYVKSWTIFLLKGEKFEY